MQIFRRGAESRGRGLPYTSLGEGGASLLKNLEEAGLYAQSVAEGGARHPKGLERAWSHR